VAAKVWNKTPKRVEKHQKMGRAKAIQTRVADLQRYHQGRWNSCGKGGPVKELRAMETCKNKKSVKNYACFCIATALTSKS